MKIENPYLFDAYSYILVTDVVTNDEEPWTGLFQTQTAPIPFYDYLNYLVTASGGLAPSQSIPLNGTAVTVAGVTLHVPNFQTGGVSNTIFTSLVQYWPVVDSLDIQLQITLHGTQLFQLTQDQTTLTAVNVPVNSYITTPQYAYGTQIIPTFKITNTNPLVTLARIYPNQGIQLWGNRYQVNQITDKVLAKQIYDSHRYTPITVSPPSF